MSIKRFIQGREIAKADKIESNRRTTLFKGVRSEGYILSELLSNLFQS